MRPPQVETALVAGAAGAIEVDITDPGDDRRGIALIAHPHPLMGGTKDNKVVTTLARTFYALGLIALRVEHLVEVHHAELHLGVISSWIRRIKREELAIFILRIHVRRAVVLAEIAVADAQFRLGAEWTLRIRLEKLGKIRTCPRPLLFLEGCVSAVEQNLIGFAWPGLDRRTRPARAGHDGEKEKRTACEEPGGRYFH